MQPPAGTLTLASGTAVVANLSPGAAVVSLSVTLDGVPVDGVSVASGSAQGFIGPFAPGPHVLEITADYGDGTRSASVRFDAVALENPDECEILNAVSCLLPYPSSRFLVPADTPTGLRLEFPAVGMPKQRNRAMPVEPYRVFDGYSPTTAATMHFPGGVDLVASDAARLMPETSSQNLRSLDEDSPTILIDADTGERVLHWLENDARPARDNLLERELLYLHASASMRPGHRYLVAMRHLVARNGAPVQPEPVFAALRDGRSTSIAAVEARRPSMEALFDELAEHGIERDDLVLAFDFTVASDASLTGQMLSMRDQAFAWLAERAGQQTFTVSRVLENDCSVPGTRIWRRVEGTFRAPLFLQADPLARPDIAATFRLGSDGMPVASGETTPPFTIAMPCTVLDPEAPPAPPVILGHGLFGDGRGFVADLAETQDIEDFNYIAAATDWTGLAALDSGGGDNIPTSFVGRVALDQPRNFPALPDRLRQGQLHTLMLARMVKQAAFNRDPAFQRPDGTGVLPGPEVEQFYFGASLGGNMGLMFAALSPDVTNVHVDVPGINFSLILPRSIAFIVFEAAIRLTGVTDPIEQALLLRLTHELWARGEAAGYATHVTSNPLPGTNVKNVLMAAAIHDQLVANQATELAARTLGLPSLVGSVMPNLAGIPDREGPLPSALVFYDAASFDPNDPLQAPFIPPLSNLPPVANGCDPHRRQAYIPAAIDQLFEFLRPGGQVANFCDGLCDASSDYELPFNGRRPCNPFD